MVTANNYVFRPLTGHHQFVHLMKTAEVTLYIVQPSNLFIRCTTWWWPVRGRNM